jgi:hypothetical protein
LPLDGDGPATRHRLAPERLRTHGVVLGMTGSGKTGLLVVVMEEAVRAGVPVLVLDVKGDMANLGLACDEASFLPWIDATELAANAPEGAEEQAPSATEHAASLEAARDGALARWGLGRGDAAELHAKLALRIITPGSRAGESLHLLSSLERPSARWNSDPDGAEAGLCSAISLVLRVLGFDADPTTSRPHVLLSALALRRLRAGESSTLEDLVGDLAVPPIERLGALSVDEFVSKSERAELAAALNAMLASPSFTSWRTGAPLDVSQWLAPREDGRTPVTIVSVAHLDDDARASVLGLVLEETLAFTRTLPGTSRLRALVVFDEVYGYLPPHPANPPTRKPLVTLMKQGRAFGVGVIVATQNPMDLDYRALSNAGLWFVGRLQTDADRARVIEAIATNHGDERGGRDGRRRKRATAETPEPPSLGERVKNLGPRWFVVRDAHEGDTCVLVKPREAMSWLKGPMTPADLRRRAGRVE